MPRALIIEDNAHARADLRDRLTAHPDIEIVGEAVSLDDARARLTRSDYDLVFLDIEIIGGNAFALVPLIPLSARLIFVTAFDAYAVRAFEVNALDYLVKPVRPARLAAALARLPTRVDETPAFGAPLQSDDRVYLRNTHSAQVVPLADITAICAAQNYTEVWLADGRHPLVRRTLASWEDSLAATDFVRVARDALVNLRQVVRFERTGEKGAALWLTARPEPVTASQRHWPQVKTRLDQTWPH